MIGIQVPWKKGRHFSKERSALFKKRSALAAVAVRASARERICAPRTLADRLAAWANRLAAWAVNVSAWERICTSCTLAVCPKTLEFLCNIKVLAQTAKVHDVQIRPQADTFTAQATRRFAQAARRSARVRGEQIRSRADARTAIAASGWNLDFF